MKNVFFSTLAEASQNGKSQSAAAVPISTDTPTSQTQNIVGADALAAAAQARIGQLYTDSSGDSRAQVYAYIIKGHDFYACLIFIKLRKSS